jgi:hypothetical protein
LDDLQERINCFGDFDRNDKICVSCCGLNFECAARHERLLSLELSEDGFSLTANARML